MYFYIYIMTNKSNSVLYIGYTSDIQKRTSEHKQNTYPNSFTKKYRANRLVYFELHHSHSSAKHREFLLKRWRRKWKEELIENLNPNYEDLAPNGIIPDEIYLRYLKL